MSTKPEEEKKEGTPLIMRTPVLDAPAPEEETKKESQYTEPAYDYICIKVTRSFVISIASDGRPERQKRLNTNACMVMPAHQE